MRAVTRGLAAMVLGTALLVVLPAEAQAGTCRWHWASCVPPLLFWSPATSGGTYNFRSVTVGHTTSQTFTLTNTGGSSSAALMVSLTGSSAFSVTADTCTATSLGPRKACTVEVSFAPAGTGIDTATLSAVGKKRAATGTLSLTGTGAVPGDIYWADSGGDTINQANLDGTNPHTLISDQNGPYAVAVYANHLYWTNYESGTINQANLDGTNPHTLISDQNGPFAVAVYANHVYWTNYDSVFGTIDEAKPGRHQPAHPSQRPELDVRVSGRRQPHLLDHLWHDQRGQPGRHQPGDSG